MVFPVIICSFYSLSPFPLYSHLEGIGIKSWLCLWECTEHGNIFQYAKPCGKGKKGENFTTEQLTKGSRQLG